MQQPSSRRGILLIDDDVHIHALIGQVVEALGYSFHAVRSGEDGLAQIEKELPLAVILDGLLPGMRGEDVARRLRSKHSAAQLPIIFVTAFYRDLKSYRFLTNECGVDALLHKPLVPDQLRAVLIQFLGPSIDVEVDAELDFEVETELLPLESEEEAELLAEYLSALKVRVAGMRTSFQSLGGASGEEALQSLRMDAHRLRGSGASYGFAEITRLAGGIEDLIERAGGDLLHAGAQRAKLDGLVDALSRKAQEAIGAAPIATIRSRGWRPRVLLIEPANGPLSKAAEVASCDSLRVCNEIDGAMEAAIDERPDVVMVALDTEGPAVAARMQKAGIGPVVLLSRGDSLAERLMAIDAGAVGYVAKPTDLEGLFRVGAVFARPRTGAQIVAAGGDRQLLTLLGETLAPYGVAVEPASEPGDYLTTVERLSPSLTVLDVDSWKMVGTKLLQVQRADLKLRRVPVVAITSEAASRKELFEAGAVAVLAKPIDPEELASIVVTQLSRRQSNEASQGRDPLTGLYDRNYLRQVCERSVSLARREGRTLAIVGFEANLEALRSAGGSLAADELLAAYASSLRHAFRESDVVARIGPTRFATLLHSVKRLDVERLIGRQLEELRQLDLGLSGFAAEPIAALALFPETAAGPDALLESVDTELNSLLAQHQEAQLAREAG